MPTTIAEILAPPHAQAHPPSWLAPSLIIFDDLQGPAAINIIHKKNHPKPKSPKQLAIISKIDRETALPDRVKTDDLLQSFAQQHAIPFTRLDSTCESEYTLPPALQSNPGIIAATTALPPTIGAQAGLAITVNVQDLAHAFFTSQVWYRRPPLQIIHLQNTLPSQTTPHDLAIILRPQITRGALLIITQSQLKPSPRFNETIVALLNDSVASAVICLASSSNAQHPPNITIDLTSVRPMIGAGPRHAQPLNNFPTTKFSRAYIGSCRTGSVDDLKLAARQLQNQKVTIPTIISPASTNDAHLLHTEKINPDQENSPTLIEIFQNAGCDVGLPGCSACVNAIATLADDPDQEPTQPQNIIATAVAGVTARATANILTASPTTAARAAISGKLA